MSMHAVAGLAVLCLVSGVHTGILWRNNGWFSRAAFVAVDLAIAYAYASTVVTP